MSPEKKIKNMCAAEGFRVVEIKRHTNYYMLECERNGMCVRLCAPNMDKAKANNPQIFKTALRSAARRMKDAA